MPGAIYKALSIIHNGIEVIQKKKKPESTVKYAFRSIEDFTNEISPLLKEANVVLFPHSHSVEHSRIVAKTKDGFDRVENNCDLQMCYSFVSCEDGSSVDVGPIPSEGLDYGDKATNKALSYAYKYMFAQMFCIAFEDIEDGDKTSSNVVGHSSTKLFQIQPPKQEQKKPTTPPKTETPKEESFLVSGRIADIKKVTTKKADGSDLKRIEIILEDGGKYSTFSSIKSASGEKQNLETGDCVNIACVQKGQYFNIITAEKFVDNAGDEGLPF